MRRKTRLLAAAVAVLVPVGVLAGTTGATAARAPLAKLAFTQGYKDTVFNKYGQVVGTYTKDGIAITKAVLGPLGGAVTAGSGAIAPVADPIYTAHSAPAPGCMLHDQFITAKAVSWAGSTVAFKYHVTGYWCWNSSYNVTTHTMGAAFTNVGANTHVDTATADVDGWSYFWQTATGGYYGYAEGAAHVGFLGQQQHAFPQIQIWMTAGPWCTGAASVRT